MFLNALIAVIVIILWSGLFYLLGATFGLPTPM